MKADRSGTLSEQIRYERGWRTATQRKAEGWPADQVCSNCLHGWEKTPLVGNHNQHRNSWLVIGVISERVKLQRSFDLAEAA